MNRISLINKISRCPNWKSLYALAEEFASNGLIITVTENGNRTLCRVEGGRPVHASVLDDYIFIESHDEYSEIPTHTLNTIKLFVEEHASNNRIIHKTPSYQRSYSLYGKAVRIANETDAIAEQQIKSISHIIID